MDIMMMAKILIANHACPLVKLALMKILVIHVILKT